MPSIISGFEYDIFISYRHNDNRSGWVTEFVNNLNEELAATIKQPVSVYFDSNPHDGLRETDDVDESLKHKLKSYIFIPIISQTYCDVRSFAWKHEFLTFKENASKDRLGLKVTLLNRNVASRILPISIHDLDTEDKRLLEHELGGPLRGVDFIYRTLGVTRPLKASEDDAKANLNHTYYRDQITKVARSVKDLIASQHTRPVTTISPNTGEDTLKSSALKRRLAFSAILAGILGLLSFSYYYFGGLGKRIGGTLDRSIAVLPFDNMSADPEQDYFSNGMTEDILNHLAKISDLKVKSRTSTLQYKGTQKSMKEIGKELSVTNIVEGSIRRVGDKVRIVVQLIDAESDVHLWSETYDRELKDVLALQSEIAMEIANTLRARLTTNEKERIKKGASQNISAYDFYLRAREIVHNTNYLQNDFQSALLLLNHAINLDPAFARAYALKGDVWFNLSSFGIKQSVWQDSSLYFISKAIAIDPKLADSYITRGYIFRYLGNFNEARADFQTAFDLAPNSPDALWAHGYQLIRDGNEKGADLILKSIDVGYSPNDPEYYDGLTDAYNYAGDLETEEKLLKKSKSLNPGHIGPYVNLANLYREKHELDKARIEIEQAEKMNPTFQGLIDIAAWIYFMSGDLENAARYWSKYPEVEGEFDDSTQTVPFRHRLAMVYAKMGNTKEAERLIKEDLQIQMDLLAATRGIGAWGGRANIYYDLAVDNSYLGNKAEAVQYIDSALNYHFNWKWGFYNDPMLDPLRERDDFKKVMNRIENIYGFRKRAFSNAISRMEASKDLKSRLK